VSLPKSPFSLKLLHLQSRDRLPSRTMLTVLFSLRDCFRAHAVLQAEILALRHQLLVLQRSSRGRRLRLRWADRVLFAFNLCGTIGARHCSWSSRRRSSPGIARGFDGIGIGRVAILKDDRVYPRTWFRQTPSLSRRLHSNSYSSL